jgi:hypothetical protein
MHVTIYGVKYQDTIKEPEQIYAEDIIPLCEQFKLHGFDIVEIKAEGLRG